MSPGTRTTTPQTSSTVMIPTETSASGADGADACVTTVTTGSGMTATGTKADAQQRRAAARHPQPARRAESSPPQSAPSSPKATADCHAEVQPPRPDPQTRPHQPPYQPPNALDNLLAAQSKLRNTPVQWDRDGAYTPSPALFKVLRAALIVRGMSFNAFCLRHGFTRQAVTFALRGDRTGPKSRQLAERFIAKVRDEL